MEQPTFSCTAGNRMDMTWLRS